MSFLKKMFKRKGKEKEEAYFLQYQPAGQRGWIPVQKFTFPVSVDEALQYMVEPGVYNLQKRVGGMISGYAWDEPYTLKGEAVPAERLEKGTESDKVAQAIEDDMLRAARWFRLPSLIKDAVKKGLGGENLGGLGGAGLEIPEGKTLEEYLDDLEQKRYERFKVQAERYGYTSKGSVSGEAFPEYEGKLPIWLHPKAIPEIVDGSLKKIEERLERWGLVGEQVSGKKMLNLPEKPLKTKRLDLSKVRKGGEEKVEKGGGEQKVE